jgi:general secretion pathway protein G
MNSMLQWKFPLSKAGLKAFFMPVFNEKHGLFGGFTLIELIVVIAIVGILAGIGVPAYRAYLDRARMTKTIADLRIIEKELLAYKSTKERFPDSLNDINRGNMKDSWGNPYQYQNVETATGVGKLRKNRFMVPINTDFDLYSMGQDGKSASPLTAKASRDDIIRGSNGKYIGLASEY